MDGLTLKVKAYLIQVARQKDANAWDRDAVRLLPQGVSIVLGGFETDLKQGRGLAEKKYRQATHKEVERAIRSGEFTPEEIEGVKKKAKMDIERFAKGLDGSFMEIIWNVRISYLRRIGAAKSLSALSDLLIGVSDPGQVKAADDFMRLDQYKETQQLVRDLVDKVGADIGTVVFCKDGQFYGLTTFRQGISWLAASGMVGMMARIMTRRVAEEVGKNYFDPDVMNGYPVYLDHLIRSVQFGVDAGVQDATREGGDDDS